MASTDTIVCGDGHLKLKAMCDALDKALRKHRKVKRIVFLGDYVDDWGATPDMFEDELSYFSEWVEAKRKDGIEVILLYGNHDFAYHTGQVGCGTVVPAYPIVVDWQKAMHPRICTVVGGRLLSHAGITYPWVEEHVLGKYGLGDSVDDIDVDALAAAINAMDTESRTHDRDALYEAGPGRGGWGLPGPMWADRSELLRYCIPNISQVVGHTPVETCQVARTSLRPKGRVDVPELVFCDTWSLTSKGRPIGDRSMLHIGDDGTIRKLTADLDLVDLDEM